MTRTEFIMDYLSPARNRGGHSGWWESVEREIAALETDLMQHATENQRLRAYAGQLEADARSVVRAYNSRKDATLYMAVEGLCATLDKDPAQPALGSLSSPQTGAQPDILDEIVERERHETGQQIESKSPTTPRLQLGACAGCKQPIYGGQPHQMRHAGCEEAELRHQSGKKSPECVVCHRDPKSNPYGKCPAWNFMCPHQPATEPERHQVRQQCACDGRHPDGSPRGNCSYPLCDTGRLDSQSVAGKKS